jgi:GNAT superfamily N-acetyltransferase
MNHLPRITPTVRLVEAADYNDWRVLWDGYNAFYGRAGETALPAHITQATWAGFFDPTVPMQCFIATADDQLVGLAHLVFHHSTSREGLVCYLQDLFTAPCARGRGVARALVERTYATAQAGQCSRVYWTTHQSNKPARKLYDKLANFKGFVVYAKEFPT